MKARDWFVVGVRLFGVWMLIDALSELTYLSEHVAGLSTGRPVLSPAGYLVHTVVDALAGGLLLVGAVPFSALFDWVPADAAKPGFPMEQDE